MVDASDVLLTDLYELTMLAAYRAAGMHEPASFELFVRRLPRERGFLLACGIEEALDYLEGLRFDDDALAWLRATGRFSRDFVDGLRGLRFTGDVDAMPDGTVAFEDEPLLRVTAPMPEAQLVETRLMNLVHFETVVASKAARSVLAAPGKVLVDFGVRRAHGLEAGLLAARAAYVAGFAGTSTVLAGRRFGVPMYGTMAHSFIEAFDDELAAFRAFARVCPENAVFLVDTYDTEAGARNVVRLAREGVPAGGVRIDSGDLAAHARRVRRILDEGGLPRCIVFASGGLDEIAVRALVRAGAPIDGFGIGTQLDTSADAPYLDCAYKLVEYAGRPRRKRSEGKATWPGRKQVWRRYDDAGVMAGDVLTLEDDPQHGEPLLQPVMQGGRRVGLPPTLADARTRVARELERLPVALKTLVPGQRYRVDVAPALVELAAAVDRRLLGAAALFR